jgi:peptide/nickel transport system permease protein
LRRFPALVVGVLAAVRRNSILDYGATVVTLLGVSLPQFLLAAILMLSSPTTLKWLPPLGYVGFIEDPIQT